MQDYYAFTKEHTAQHVCVAGSHMKVGGKEMGASVQPAKERPPCIEVRKGIVKNDVLSMYVLQGHI